MSAKERAYGIIDSMNEEQLNAFFMLFGNGDMSDEETAAVLREVESIDLGVDFEGEEEDIIVIDLD